MIHYPIELLKQLLFNTFNVTGYASRKSYWHTLLCAGPILFLLLLLLSFGLKPLLDIFLDQKLFQTTVTLSDLFFYFFRIFIALPVITLSIRRLHDAGLAVCFAILLLVLPILCDFTIYFIGFRYIENPFFHGDTDFLMKVILTTLLFRILCGILVLIFLLRPSKK